MLTLADVESELSAIEAELIRRRAQPAYLERDIPRALRPLLAPARYKGAYGGRGSAKSHTFATMLLAKAKRQPIRWVCVREIQKSLKSSVKLLLEDKINQYQLTEDFRVLDTHIECPHDGVITFQGMQDHTAISIKSLEGYDGAWVEEAQALSARSLKLLRPTIRKAGSELWFSWNPDQPTDPVDEMLRGTSPPPGAIVIQTTWRDNPHFPIELQREMEWDRSRDTEAYEHIWEGDYERHANARVFKNWRIEDVPEESLGMRYYGADWGYSVDPAVIVRIREVKGKPKRLHIDGESYGVGVEIDDLPTHFDKVDNGDARNWPVVADSSRPDTISYMKRHGYKRMEPSAKGKDSVKEGVIFLQGYDITIDPACRHTQDEFKNYNYEVDKLTDVVTPVLEDKKNHVIDSVRYATEKLHRAGKPTAGVW